MAHRGGTNALAAPGVRLWARARNCPYRALIQESVYDRFMDRCLARIAKIRQGDPLDASTQMGYTQTKSLLVSYHDQALGLF